MKTTLTLPTSKVTRAIAFYEEEHEANGLKLDTSGKRTEIKLDEQPDDFIDALLEVGNLSKRQREIVIGFMPKVGAEELRTREVGSARELFNFLRNFSTGHGNVTEPNMCVLVADQWYPFKFNVNFQQSYYNKTGFVMGEVVLTIVDKTISRDWFWSDSAFVKDNKPVKRKVIDLLRENNLRPIKPGEVEEYNRKIALCDEYQNRSKTVHDVIGPVLVHNPWSYFNPLQERILGSESKPKKIILEDELELQQDNRSHRHDMIYHDDNDTVVRLPFVRAFSLDLKEYVYVDADNIRDHVFDDSARDKLVLHDKMQKILDMIFATDSDEIFGDMFSGRHGGMIVLANGRPGVGKTLTAEVFAEFTKRPLYVLEMGELGTNLSTVESNMTKIFMRATRWNAILLFDEADVFLSKRGEDLDRNAIVGVFLRLLDHYDGMLFLTTNRKEVLDPAFQSRITLYLDYPDLSPDAREKIWRHLLASAGFELSGDLPRAREHSINGRQIRNIVRLLKITSKGRTTITEDDIIPLFDFTFKTGE